MLKNKDFKSKKLGDYNLIIITRGMEFRNVLKYSLENKKQIESLKNKLFLFIGKKLQEIVAFGEGTGTKIVDVERDDDFEKEYYNDIVLMKSSAFAVYSEFNAPICTRIQQNDIIVAIVNNLGDKAICKLDINKIENLSEILTKLENKDKKTEIEAVIYCNKEEIVKTNNIIRFKQKLKKIGVKEEGIVNYDLDREYVINVNKLFFDILNQYDISNIKVIEYLEEDADNLMLFI